ncbi:MAG: CCA tRNA nucleotidyltransferase [Thermoguttaceae bacterium]
MPSFSPSDKSRRIVGLLLEAGASDAFYVGGAVRDYFFGLVPKDFDIEVYGLSYKQILSILRPHFRVGLVGQSFGTVKVDNDVDISIPRTESKVGVGHKGFAISADPSLDPRIAFARRDFTINAIGMRFDGSLFDPFDGHGDIQRKILRAPSEAFCEDPLRVLRGMQLAARFDLEMEPHTIELSRQVYPEIETLSAERVWGEWFKWATKSEKPSRGLDILRQTGWIGHFPEIAALIGTKQNPEYHPEGDAFVHTQLVCDAAAQIAIELELEEMERAILLFAALAHDFGKPCTTIRSPKGKWKSPNHASEGVPIAANFLERMRAPNWALLHVLPLVQEHMAHTAIPKEETPSYSSVRRLADRLAPSNIRMWAALSRADSRGTTSPKPRYRPETWEEVAEKLKIREDRPKPLLQGRHLIPLGIKPGPEMGHLLHSAFQSQLDGVFDNLPDALAWLKTVQKSP